MYPVEIPVEDEENVVKAMEVMRTWLDHKRFEPASFRYTTGRSRAVFRVDFLNAAEANAFAKAFSGEVVLS